MSYMPWFTVLLIAILGIFARPVNASSVAVLPTTYMDLATGTVDENAATDFHRAIVKGITDEGFDVVPEYELAPIVTALLPDGNCNDACLDAVKKTSGADEVVYVQIVEDSSMASRNVTVEFADRDGFEKDTMDGYKVVMAWLQGRVLLALKDKSSPDSTSGNATAEMMPGNDYATSAEEILWADDWQDRGKIGPAPLLICGGITVLLGATTVILDALSHHNYKILDENIDTGEVSRNEFERDIKTIENQQLMTKIFLGATAVGFATTGILLFFTDFSKSKRAKRNHANFEPALLIGKDSGAILIGGSF